jgi:hypothetical protein
MINPTKDDIGRSVIYRRDSPRGETEEGVITSYNDFCVFVRYGANKHSQSTLREDLDWATS